MIRLFCGYDKREAIGFHVFVSSVLQRASVPVGIIPLGDIGQAHGTNAFTRSRFLVPYLCGYEGWAIFADASDMLMHDDIGKLMVRADATKAVQLVQHDYWTRHPVKYLGTDMECVNSDYSRKNWASFMLINCEHPAWRKVTPEFVKAAAPLDLLRFQFMVDRDIGALPGRWNRLVDEGQPIDDAAVLHWTAGIPAFEHYKNAPGARLWHLEKQLMEQV